MYILWTLPNRIS